MNNKRSINLKSIEKLTNKKKVEEVVKRWKTQDCIDYIVKYKNEFGRVDGLNLQGKFKKINNNLKGVDNDVNKLKIVYNKLYDDIQSAANSKNHPSITIFLQQLRDLTENQKIQELLNICNHTSTKTPHIQDKVTAVAHRQNKVTTVAHRQNKVTTAAHRQNKVTTVAHSQNKVTTAAHRSIDEVLNDVQSDKEYLALAEGGLTKAKKRLSVANEGLRATISRVIRAKNRLKNSDTKALSDVQSDKEYLAFAKERLIKAKERLSVAEKELRFANNRVIQATKRLKNSEKELNELKGLN